MASIINKMVCSVIILGFVGCAYFLQVSDATTVGAAAGVSESVAEKKIKVVLKNKCDFAVWPGVYPGLDTLSEDLKPKVKMHPDESKTLSIRPWNSDIYVWGRTACDAKSSSPKSGSSFGFHSSNAYPNPEKPCLTGNCGAGYGFQCFFGKVDGPPVSVALFRSFNYTVDVTSGFNLPMTVEPTADKSKSSKEDEDDEGADKLPKSKKDKCRIMGCKLNMKDICPEDMQVRLRNKVVACSPIKNSRKSQEAYLKLIKKHCPCSHPVAPPSTIPQSQYSDGYTVTFCPEN